MAIQSSLALGGCSGLYRCLRRGGSARRNDGARRDDSARRNDGGGPGSDSRARGSRADGGPGSDGGARGSRTDDGPGRYRSSHHCASGRRDVQDGHSALRPPHA